jgi:hypothetical protein
MYVFVALTEAAAHALFVDVSLTSICVGNCANLQEGMDVWMYAQRYVVSFEMLF